MIDWIQGERFMALANNEDIFYCHTHDVNYFFKHLPTEKPFILISHNSDGCIMRHPNREDHADVGLMPPNLIHWFGQNVNTVNVKVSSLPLGMENNRWLKKERKLKKMEEKVNEPRKIRNLLYVNHNVATNPEERQRPYFLFAKQDWATVKRGKNGESFYAYLDDLYNHQFILSPQGHGIDTVRTWEALYMGTIPIEKRNLNNRFYEDLPICFVSEWEQITEEFLQEEYVRIMTTKWNLEKLNFEYWANKIRNYDK